MFHWRDGLFFERQADGSVRIVKRDGGREDAPVIFEAEIPAAEWESVEQALKTTY